MKRFSNHISFALSLLVFLGLSLSVVHTHFSETLVPGDTEVHLTEDVNECAICASHFKFSSERSLQSSPAIYSQDVFPQVKLLTVAEPLPGINQERAPPFVVIYG